MSALVTFPIGLLFGLGLVLSGMINPEKVIGFLDWTGAFDPSLAFVMSGALVVTIPGYHFLLRRKTPLIARNFDLPAKNEVDSSLVSGALMFGVGWGLAGLCPGPAISALGSGRLESFIFVAAMIVGMLLKDQPWQKAASGPSLRLAS